MDAETARVIEHLSNHPGWSAIETELAAIREDAVRKALTGKPEDLSYQQGRVSVLDNLRDFLTDALSWRKRHESADSSDQRMYEADPRKGVQEEPHGRGRTGQGRPTLRAVRRRRTRTT